MSEFDDFFDPRPERGSAPADLEPQRLGIVVGGSLSKGLDVKLDRDTDLESVNVGSYAVVRGTGRRYFCGITDIALDSASPFIDKSPPDIEDDFVREVIHGTTTFGRVHVAPWLVLEQGANQPKPVKSVPAHFAPVYAATADEVNLIFGQEDAGCFEIGEPLDMEGIKIYLNLRRFAERSSGIFGKSGTGKTYLTRMLLAGMIQNDVAVNLIFDMHNEYGWEGSGERHKVKGLKQLYGGRVAIFTLDEESSRRRGSKVDEVIQIGYSSIEPEDVEMLQGVMGLSDLQVGALHAIYRKLGCNWIAQLLEDKAPAKLQDLIEADQLHSGTLGAIQRKLGLFHRFGFLRSAGGDAVANILNYIQKGVNVVLEFGRYGNSLEAYLLVANFLTRRIHHAYVDRKEAAQGGADEPRQLVITIEEAHKFLDPLIARQTIFGTISRELRKYNVTLLIVDQRPSGIDPEIMSQVGTRVTCLLDDEQDIRAVFAGISGASELRQVLARLDTRQQALILGHAVPMPVVVRTRDYDASFYASAGWTDGAALKALREKGSRQLYGDDEGL
jgi:DNA helicase HerA-like ATPase